MAARLIEYRDGSETVAEFASLADAFAAQRRSAWPSLVEAQSRSGEWVGVGSRYVTADETGRCVAMACDLCRVAPADGPDRLCPRCRDELASDDGWGV